VSAVRERRALSHRDDERQRALALPWNIYGDQQDSLAVLSSG